jgi:Tannase and feruloyl esterase
MPHPHTGASERFRRAKRDLLTASALSLLMLGSASAQAQDQKAASCAALSGRTVAADAIGLPTKGATIASAKLTAATPAGQDARGGFTPAQPEYCQILGSIAPVDSNAPAIRFQLNLPSTWNGKAVQYGGGGFNGILITGLAALRDTPPGAETPLFQGYATFGTDSGHQEESLPEIQAFALNEEALTNFAHASYKKTRDVAVALIRDFYGRPPGRTYYFGGSEGGREGLVVAQRYPADYDGIVSAVPVINWVALQASGTYRGGTMQQKGGWLNAAKVAAVRKGVLTACDGLDGLTDGLISHPDACAKAFDVKALRCPDGADSGESCLSDRQVATMQALRTPYQLPFELANGLTTYPAFGYGGEDQPGGMLDWSTGPEAPQMPLPAPNRQGRIWYYGGGAMRYFIARDPKLDPRSFDPAAYKERMRTVSELMDATNPDLSAFLARGGKLILKENMADYAQSPYAGIEYYRSVVAHMGQETADRFVRLYLAPGANHTGRVFSGIDQTPLPSHVNLLEELDAWVEQGRAPADVLRLTAHEVKPPHAVTATRPMCRWPLYPRYNGSGDQRAAESFTCAVP